MLSTSVEGWDRPGFSLGMDEWLKEDQPPRKRKCLSLTRRSSPLQDSTNQPVFVDASILQEADKGVIPLKTEQSTLWAVKNFDCWVHARSSSSSNVVPPDLLRSHAELVLLCPGNEKVGWITLPASDCAVASEQLKLHLAFQETLITDISLP